MQAAGEPERADATAGERRLALSVVESWRVETGRVIAHVAHRTRFEESVAMLFGSAATAHPLLWSDGQAGTGPRESDWYGIWEAALAAVPLTDAWFPRLTARFDDAGRVCVEFVVRPAPQARPLTKLATRSDGRKWPTMKGPDFPLLAELRADAVGEGADDALLVDERGNINEAANGTVVGWLGETLVVPPASRRVPGTTHGALTKLLEMSGVKQTEGELRADPLAASADRGWDELWYLNTLHGISPVSQLNGTRLGLDVARVRRWRPRLEALSTVPSLAPRPRRP